MSNVEGKGRAMSVLHKVKAYFGMVPAEPIDEYDDERYRDRRPMDSDHYSDDHYRDERFRADPDEFDDYPARRYDDRRHYYPRFRDDYRREDYRHDFEHEFAEREPEYADVRDDRPTDRLRGNWDRSEDTAPRGTLTALDARREANTRLRAVDGASSTASAATTQQSGGMARVTTLHPHSFSEARTIGEYYRDGTPVIINLTEMADADAKRLVDFAAGLAFAMRGDIDKVTSKVFLLSPPNHDVAAEDKRRIAEGTFFNYG